MTKNEIIRCLQLLPPYRIKFLEIVFHKETSRGSFYYRYTYSAMSEFTDVPLCEVLSSLYKLRSCVRSINLVYFDTQGTIQRFDYRVSDCIDCDTFSDFVNSK